MPRSPKLETKGNLRIMRYSTRFIVLCRKLVNLGRIFMYKNIYKYMSTTLSIITGCRRRHTIKVIKSLCVAFEAAVARLFSPYSRLLRAKALAFCSHSCLAVFCTQCHFFALPFHSLGSHFPSIEAKIAPRTSLQ